MTLICMKMKLRAELIFIWKVSHLDSFWNRGTRELGNGLLNAHINVKPSRRGGGKARHRAGISLLVEVSHDETNWNVRRETSAGFQRVSYHACPRVSLTTSDVFCHVWHNAENRFEFERERERLLNLSARSNFKCWRWNDLASGRCRGPHYKSLRKAEEANFKANFSPLSLTIYGHVAANLNFFNYL